MLNQIYQPDYANASKCQNWYKCFIDENI